jgi:hypothetical protein
MVETQTVKVSYNGNTCGMCCGLGVLFIIGYILYDYGVPNWIIGLIALIIVCLVFVYPAYRLYRWDKNRKAKFAYAKYTWQDEQRRQEEQRQTNYSYYNNDSAQNANRIIEDNPFDILGISEYASDSEVKAAYRYKCTLWHPDKFRPEQLDDPKFNKMINDEMSKINSAYEQIKRLKGWN